MIKDSGINLDFATQALAMHSWWTTTQVKIVSMYEGQANSLHTAMDKAVPPKSTLDSPLLLTSQALQDIVLTQKPKAEISSLAVKASELRKTYAALPACLWTTHSDKLTFASKQLRGDIVKARYATSAAHTLQVLKDCGGTADTSSQETAAAACRTLLHTKKLTIPDYMSELLTTCAPRWSAPKV